MGALLSLAALVVGGFVALVLFMQLFVRVRARLQAGKSVPPLGGPLGKHLARGRPALVYFHSPGCAACRPITPKIEELSRRKDTVYVVDVSRDLQTARALKVLATPSFVEIEAGKVVGFRVGLAPAEMLARYAG